MSDKDPNDGKGEDDFGPEDELDAFNDETFGGGGLGDEWKEDAHEELAMLTEQERTALKQSQDFFNFGSDGEELGGELEDGLEAAPTQNGGGGGAQLSHSSMVERMDQLSLQGGGLPPPPLTVQTQHQQPQHFPGPPQQQQQQQVIYHHQLPPQHQQPLPPQQLMQQPQQPQQQQFPLLPPSHFSGGLGPGPAGGQFHDPAIMSLSKMPPPQAPAHYLPQPQQQPPYLPQQPQPQQFPARPAFSPATVPGMKTLADIEAEMMYGGPPPGAGPGPGPMMMERGGHVGHINPAVHNLNYPGMRDRQTQQHQRAHQQQHQQQQQQHQAQQMQQQQFRNSPGLSNQQQLQQGLQQQLKHKDHNSQQKIHPPQHHQQHRMNNNHYGDGGNRRRNDNQYDNRRDQFYDRDQRDREQDNYQRQRRYNDPNRRNEETFGAAAVREAEFKGMYCVLQLELENSDDNLDMCAEYGDQSVTRRDLMPGHVHTLGILRHSRSRHDRHNHETFGEELEEQMAANPTGDPLLDARMVEEEEEMARRRKHYANSEDEYAGLMSQKDKQWIINIQLNQLKCDNPYVDDYYFTMFQAR